MTEETLETLAIDLYNAKKSESDAKTKRTDIEDAIAVLVPTGDNESKTVKAGELKVSVKRGLIYKTDIDGIRALDLDDIPVQSVPAVPAGWAFDEKAYEAMREKNPAAFKAVAEFVTTKPRKVSVELKLA